MTKTGAALVGGLLGTLAALAVGYLYGPAPGTRYDATYRSRLDHALDEGRHAAQEHEQALLRQYQGLKLRTKPESE